MAQPKIDRLNYHSTHRNLFYGGTGRLTKERLNLILENVDIKGKRILDLGCSGGYFTFNLSAKAKHVMGVDGDYEIIKDWN